MAENLFKKMQLDNNLVLEVYDASRQIAGDRWLVTLIARVDIPLQEHLRAAERLPASVGEIERRLGPTVRFEQKRERNFVDAARKEEVFADLSDFFLDSLLEYLSHPDFPRRYILKAYNEALKRESLYREDE